MPGCRNVISTIEEFCQRRQQIEKSIRILRELSRAGNVRISVEKDTLLSKLGRILSRPVESIPVEGVVFNVYCIDGDIDSYLRKILPQRVYSDIVYKRTDVCNGPALVLPADTAKKLQGIISGATSFENRVEEAAREIGDILSSKSDELKKLADTAEKLASACKAFSKYPGGVELLKEADCDVDKVSDKISDMCSDLGDPQSIRDCVHNWVVQVTGVLRALSEMSGRKPPDYLEDVMLVEIAKKAFQKAASKNFAKGNILGALETGVVASVVTALQPLIQTVGVVLHEGVLKGKWNEVKDYFVQLFTGIASMAFDTLKTLGEFAARLAGNPVEAVQWLLGKIYGAASSVAGDILWSLPFDVLLAVATAGVYGAVDAGAYAAERAAAEAAEEGLGDSSLLSAIRSVVKEAAEEAASADGVAARIAVFVKSLVSRLRDEIGDVIKDTILDGVEGKIPKRTLLKKLVFKGFKTGFKLAGKALLKTAEATAELATGGIVSVAAPQVEWPIASIMEAVAVRPAAMTAKAVGSFFSRLLESSEEAAEKRLLERLVNIVWRESGEGKTLSEVLERAARELRESAVETPFIRRLADELEEAASIARRIEEGLATETDAERLREILEGVEKELRSKLGPDVSPLLRSLREALEKSSLRGASRAAKEDVLREAVETILESEKPPIEAVKEALGKIRAKLEPEEANEIEELLKPKISKMEELEGSQPRRLLIEKLGLEVPPKSENSETLSVHEFRKNVEMLLDELKSAAERKSITELRDALGKLDEIVDLSPSVAENGGSGGVSTLLVNREVVEKFESILKVLDETVEELAKSEKLDRETAKSIEKLLLKIEEKVKNLPEGEAAELRSLVNRIEERLHKYLFEEEERRALAAELRSAFESVVSSRRRSEYLERLAPLGELSRRFERTAERLEEASRIAEESGVKVPYWSTPVRIGLEVGNVFAGVTGSEVAASVLTRREVEKLGSEARRGAQRAAAVITSTVTMQHWQQQHGQKSGTSAVTSKAAAGGGSSSPLVTGGYERRSTLTTTPVSASALRASSGTGLEGRSTGVAASSEAGASVAAAKLAAPRLEGVAGQQGGLLPRQATSEYSEVSVAPPNVKGTGSGQPLGDILSGIEQGLERLGLGGVAEYIAPTVASIVLGYLLPKYAPQLARRLGIQRSNAGRTDQYRRPSVAPVQTQPAYTARVAPYKGVGETWLPV